MSSCIAIIPARGGSQRIHLKNIRPFHGKPIIQYSIEAAIKAEIFDTVVVSTDSEEVADISVEAGALIHLRPASLSRDEVGTQEVIKNVVEHLHIDEQKCSDKYAFTCCLYATAPMVDPAELRRASAYLKLDKKIDYMVPVAQWLKDPGRWYMGRTSCFLNEVPLIGQGTRLMKVDPKRSIDINFEEDWAEAEAMYAELYL